MKKAFIGFLLGVLLSAVCAINAETAWKQVKEEPYSDVFGTKVGWVGSLVVGTTEPMTVSAVEIGLCSDGSVVWRRRRDCSSLR